MFIKGKLGLMVKLILEIFRKEFKMELEFILGQVDKNILER